MLGAGLSSRMGRNKLLLEIDGCSLLRRAAGAAIEAGLAPVLVVVGHQAEQARAQLDGLACTPVLNPDYATGQESSLRAGAQALPGGLQGAVVLLADMPLVTSAMVRAVAERLLRGPEPLVLSTFGSVAAPPTGYGAALFDELRALEGGGCGKRVVKRHRAEAAELAWPAEALADTDLPEEFARVRALLEGAPAAPQTMGGAP